MLLDFRVKNFKSIRDEQILSMEAMGSCSELREVLRAPDALPGDGRLLPAVAIFGANASGKSTFAGALGAMRRMVLESFSKSDDEDSPIHGFVPHRLDPACANLPVEVEVSFIEDGMRHRYGFAVLEGRVVSESLTTWPNKRAKLVFSRGLATREDGTEFKPGNGIKGGKQRAASAYDQTHPQSLFLSTAQKLNNPAVQSTHNWIRERLRILDSNQPLSTGYTAKRCMSNKPLAMWTDELMQCADFGIARIKVTERDLSETTAFKAFVGSAPDESRGRMAAVFQAGLGHNIEAIHMDRQGKPVLFDLKHDESHGTRRLFALAGPLWDVLEHGRVLCIDELESGLHHWLVRQLVTVFQSPELNPNGAQLIFTSHDPLLLDLALLRRDQLCFVKKDSEGASGIYSLADFHTKEGARKDSAQLHKRYLSGVYGAIPSLRGLLKTGIPEKATR